MMLGAYRIRSLPKIIFKVFLCVLLVVPEDEAFYWKSKKRSASTDAVTRYNSQFGIISNLQKVSQYSEPLWSEFSSVAPAHYDSRAILQRRIALAQNFLILERIRHYRKKPWWGQWSTWSACGRTCGSGVQFQQRHCLGLRRRKYVCNGPTRKYRICATTPCPSFTPSFRRLQCSQLASKQVRGKYYSWRPYGHPEDEIVSNEPCQLVCVSNMDNVQFNTIAMDGTECKRGWDDGRCVRGKCRLIGCDGKINSTVLRDECGKCTIDNETSCLVTKEEFSHHFESAGEVKIVRIPKNSYDILIVGRRRFLAYIVVKDKNGTTLFFGGSASFIQSGPRNTDLAGAEFRYRQSEQHTTYLSFTYLLTVGPILQDIVVYLSSSESGLASVQYEFKTPKIVPGNTKAAIAGHQSVDLHQQALVPSKTPLSMMFEDSSENTTITQASPTPSVIPFRTIKVNPSPKLGSAESPAVRVAYKLVPTIEPKTRENENFLYIRELKDTSALPSDNSPDNTTGMNELPSRNGESVLHFVKPSFIVEGYGTSNGSYVPHLLKPVNDIAGMTATHLQLSKGNTSGNASDYSTEGEDAGEDYDVVPGVDVSKPIGASLNGLHEDRYDGYTWRSTGFAPCSSTCSRGLQDTYAVCERIQGGTTVDDGFCDPRTRPEPVRASCARQTCEPRWEATPWSECSRSCGVGQRSRSVRCWRMIESGFDSTVYNELCNDLGSVKPHERESCQVVQHCGPLWETSDWSPCQAPCETVGVKWRTVRCSAGNDRMCASAPRPHSRERCHGPKCLLKWITSEWGECSGACGGGRKMRRVVCSDGEGVAHPDNKCDITSKPVTSNPCGDENCRPEWIAQDWEQCSVECGQGIRKRAVICSGIVNGVVHHYNNDTPCSGASKPLDQEPCKQRDCDPAWFTTSWSKCSVTCGRGNRVRLVKCYWNGAPTEGCHDSIRPDVRESCQMQACPKPHTAACRNKPSVNCDLVVRVHLCSHWYYSKACCASCQPAS